MDAYMKLKNKVDSLAGTIRFKQNQLASLNDRSVYNRKEQGVTTRSEFIRDLGILNMQYTESVTSLESAKGSLSTQSQVVRIVDAPRYSMFLDERKQTFWGIIGGIVGGFFTVLILCIVKASKDAFKEEKDMLIAQNINQGSAS
jgi:hypothetical protein